MTSIAASEIRRVVINGRFLSRRLTGVDRFALESIKAINALLASNDESFHRLTFCIYVPPDTVCDFQWEHVPVLAVGRRQGQLWEQWDLPRSLSPNDLLLSLCNTAPFWLENQVVVVHDAATVRVPNAFSWAFRTWYRLLIPQLGRRAKRVLTVSDFSLKEVSSAFGISKEKMGVVAESGEHVARFTPDPDCLARFGLNMRPFVLAVSSMAPHKNFKLVLDALRLLADPPFDVAIAGGMNTKVFGSSEMASLKQVKWLGYVTDAELRTLYQSAQCFVFPSLYEGFGIPPLEAMVCGCPVLSSSAASMPEVCGPAALYFDPHSPVELADLLMKIFQESGICAKLRADGLRRSSEFRWETTARQLVDACREAVVA